VKEKEGRKRGGGVFIYAGYRIKTNSSIGGRAVSFRALVGGNLPGRQRGHYSWRKEGGRKVQEREGK